MKYASLCLAMLLVVPSLIAGTSVGWRHNATGRFPDAKAPTEWSAEKGVIWKTKLDNWSNASPVLFKDKIFTCVEPATLLCLSASNGEILWKQDGSYAQIFSKEEKAKAEKAGTRIKVLQAEKKQLSRELKKAQKEGLPADALKEMKSKLSLLSKEEKELAPFAVPRTHGVNGYTSPTPVTDGNIVVANFGN